MRIPVRLLYLALAAFVCGACASAIDTGPASARLETPDQFEIPAPTAEDSLVVIYATRSPGAACFIYLNDQRIAALRPNSFTFAMLQPGVVTLDTRMGNGTPVTIDARPGHINYVRMTVDEGVSGQTANLESVSAETGRGAIADLRYVRLRD